MVVVDDSRWKWKVEFEQEGKGNEKRDLQFDSKFVYSFDGHRELKGRRAGRRVAGEIEESENKGMR